MPPILHLVCHAQGEHNVNNFHYIRGPMLTDLGKRQCQELRKAFQHHEDISLVLASPLKRTELSHLTCDLGVDRKDVVINAPKLIAEGAPAYNLDKLDLSMVGENWNSKAGIYAPTLNAVRRRAASLRSWLWQRPEKCIVLVTHGGFLHYLTEDWTGYDRSRGTGYMNCETRQYEFSSGSTQDDAHLVEVGISRERVDRPAGLDAHVIHEIDEIERVSE
ncbi:histidine phosphatase superfamily [Aspergillus avenaceus]|uniref:Histidine phosphatase superfamily n=1 Tax=Aspergillus avenaceus TaxID=36643 RepID=A0A5N6TZV4_ASPAV|nr:histidine phosphatase superfamily [Aspergillus avenaceus]